MNRETELIKKAIAEQVEKNNIAKQDAQKMLENCDAALLISKNITREELTELISRADDEKKQKLLSILNNIK